MKNKPYIILTGGDGGYGNLGDEWLSEATKAHYRRLADKFQIIFLKANPPKFTIDKFRYVTDEVDKFQAENIRTEDIAAVHYYGGGYLNNYWMEEKLWLYDHLTKKGLSRDKFFFTGQGLGPLDASKTKRLRAVAHDSVFFGTRDNSLSREIESTFMFDESIYLVSSAEGRHTGKRNELWVNFRAASHVGADEAKLSKLLQQLLVFAQKENLTIKYFAMIKGKNFDEKVEFERILKANGISSPVIGRARNYKGLMKQFKNAALIVTTSYHATLAGIYTAVPVAAVYENQYYDLKFRGLKEAFDTPLLHLHNLANGRNRAWGSIIDSSDPDLSTKIANLKKINDEAYSIYEKFLKKSH